VRLVVPGKANPGFHKFGFRSEPLGMAEPEIPFSVGSLTIHIWAPPYLQARPFQSGGNKDRLQSYIRPCWRERLRAFMESAHRVPIDPAAFWPESLSAFPGAGPTCCAMTFEYLVRKPGGNSVIICKTKTA